MKNANSKIYYSVEGSVIEYPDSPDGKAYIGVAKRPLMKNRNGRGFQGVLIQNTDRTLVECAACGKWQKTIGSAHLMKYSKLTPDKYKNQFGLNPGRGLVSDVTSLKLTQNALKNKKTISGMGSGAREEKYRDKYKTWGSRRQGRQTRQKENMFGTCPLQLQERLYQFIRDNREFPSQNNRGRSIYKAIRRRFGKFGSALPRYGLPKMDRVGTNMRFIFSDGEE